MQSIKAVYDGVGFSPKQPIPVNVDYEVIITFVEPVKIDTTHLSPEETAVVVRNMLSEGRLRLK